MTKVVELEARAARDIQTAVDYYATEAGSSVAHRFVSALDEAFELLGGHPLLASTRWAHEVGIPELRSWSLQHFPYVVFYVDGPSAVDIWRVLHASRDIPASLASYGGGG